MRFRHVISRSSGAVRSLQPSTSMMRVARSEQASAFPLEAIGRAASAEELTAIVREARWDAFDPETHFVALRDALARAEASFGVTEAHALCTQRIAALARARRTMADATETRILAFALRPDGAYFACATKPEHAGDEEGDLDVWEVATGVRVNRIPRLALTGYDGAAGRVQWTAGGHELAAAFRTNAVGRFLPFSTCGAVARVAVTAGSPPAFAASPSGTEIAVATATRSPLCFASFRAHETRADEARWLSAEAPLFDAHVLRWTEGGLLVGARRNASAFGFDVARGSLVWSTAVGEPVSISPDGTRLVHYADDGRLVMLDTATGEALHDDAGCGEVRSFVWSGDGHRLAAVTDVDVRIYGRKGLVTVIEICAESAVDPDELAPPGVVAFAPDASRLATLGPDGEVTIWSLAAFSKPLGSIAVDVATIGIAWGAGDVLVTVAETGVRLWSIRTGREVRTTPAIVVSRRWAWPERWDAERSAPASAARRRARRSA